jgi:hypothetical protein
MASLPFESPVEDSVPKVDGSMAVGEDLAFQRKWWRFEKAIWIFFAVLLLCDLLGLFGRGYFAKAERSTSDQTLRLEFERVERASTPSIMTLHFGESAIRDGKVRVFVSQSVIKDLGAARISPQPVLSTINNGGITYTFAADGPAIVEIALSPSFPGRHHFSMQVAGGEAVQGNVYVVP